MQMIFHSFLLLALIHSFYSFCKSLILSPNISIVNDYSMPVNILGTVSRTMNEISEVLVLNEVVV